MKHPFEKSYPHITRWIQEFGWIEMGRDNYSYSFVRAIDEGGMVWEGEHTYERVDEALKALDEGIAEWLHDNFDGK